MPFRNLHHPALENLVREADLEQRINSSHHVFPSNILKNDAPDMLGDEWDGWLKWDGTIGALPSFESRRQSTGSSLYGSDSSAMHMIKNPESIFYDDILEDDAPFELEDSITSPSSPLPPFSQLEGQPMRNPGRPLHAYSTLSATEERRLREIAMPDHLMVGFASLHEEEDVEISTEAQGKPIGAKRKSSISTEDPADVYRHRKKSHNTIEKRYRIKLNDKIDMLRRSIPKFQDVPSQIMEDGEEDENTVALAYKTGKAAVLTGAVEYIAQLENSAKLLALETTALKARLEAFEKLAKCGSIFSGEDTGSKPDISEEIQDFEQAEPSRHPAKVPKH